MKYEPDPYCVKISVRKDNFRALLHSGPLFNTWEEAHQTLVTRCQMQLVKAEKDLLARKRALKRTLKLEPK